MTKDHLEEVIYGLSISGNSMTLSDLQDYSPIASVVNCDFSYSCLAIDEIATDVARHAVPLPYLSFLSVLTANAW